MRDPERINREIKGKKIMGKKNQANFPEMMKQILD